jgi:hypothetical protein
LHARKVAPGSRSGTTEPCHSQQSHPPGPWLLRRRPPFGVEEVLIVDPSERKVHWLELSGGEYRDVRHSGLIDLAPDELSERIDWPPIEDS